MTESCLIIHPILTTAASEREHGRDLSSLLAEAEGLAKAIQLDVLGVIPAKVYKISAGHLLGSGAREEIKTKIEELTPSVVIINSNLSPVQQRNLERDWQTKVIDRTGLILEIFGARAHTKEGRLQVDLAALSYQRSRLVKSWTHLERQRGGTSSTGGPGETQLEIDRRIIDGKIAAMKLQIESVRQNRDLQRQSRERVPFPIVALVGYTNAGKSTLFNKLTGAEVFAQDLLFATLDPTMRRLKIPSGRLVILSDTVGFISDLPTHLVAAFRATLEQVQYADVILHVRDISSPDTDAQREDVVDILKDLGIEYETDPRIIEVLNKIDLLSDEAIIYREPDFRGRQIELSAISGEGIPALLDAIEKVMAHSQNLMKIRLSVTEGKALAWLHRHASIVSRTDNEEDISLEVSISPSEQEKFLYQFPNIKAS